MYRFMRSVKPLVLGIYRLIEPVLTLLGFNFKERYEFMYWQSRKATEGVLTNARYERMYTDLIGIPKSFYDDKKILDIGCGPRGSLEWATNADERIGLDPLVNKYKRLGIDDHQMDYVNAPSEDMPFDDHYFDVVLSLNSLDHVDDLTMTLAEIKRVTKIGGECIIIVHVHPKPTIAEPIALPWNLTDQLQDAFDIVEEKHFEKLEKDSIIKAITRGTEIDQESSNEVEGFLYARLRRKQ